MHLENFLGALLVAPGPTQTARLLSHLREMHEFSALHGGGHVSHWAATAHRDVTDGNTTLAALAGDLARAHAELRSLGIAFDGHRFTLARSV